MSNQSDEIIYYRIQQATGEGTPRERDWKTIDRVDVGSPQPLLVQNEHGAYTRHVRLADWMWYWWRVQPVDQSLNVGEGEILGPLFVRPPPPERFVLTAVTFGGSTRKVAVKA